MCVCWQVIPPGWLKLFNTQEVNQLLGGGESGVLDVADMAAHAHYSGGYSKDHATVRLFWKVRSETSMHGVGEGLGGGGAARGAPTAWRLSWLVKDSDPCSVQPPFDLWLWYAASARCTAQ